MRTLAAPLLFACLSVAALAKEPPVTLHVEHANGQLVPGSAFELRFNERMVPEDAVGKPGTEPPLALKPAVVGKWTWVSTQSGVFQPTEAPRLSTSIEVTLRSDLRNAEGKAFRANLKEVFVTPGFRVKGWYATNHWSPEDASAQPRIGVCFSADVDPASAAKSMWFINDAKTRIEATTEHIDLRKTPFGFPAYRSDDHSTLTWVEQFREFRESGGKKGERSIDDDGEPIQKAGPVSRNQLYATPVRALPPGSNWKLVVAKGFTSVDGYQLPLDAVFDIGTITPFSVSRVAPENLVYSGKRITVQFSKPLHKEVRKNPAKFVSITPAVDKLQIAVPDDIYGDRNQVLITGAFELAKDYALTVAAETAAQEPFT